jgi:hypothetical protein
MAGAFTETKRFVQVEGKWVLQAMAAMWSVEMAKAKAWVEGFDLQQDLAMTQQIDGGLTMVEEVLDILANAETEEQFNSRLAAMPQMMAIIMGMMMMQQQQQGQQGGC